MHPDYFGHPFSPRELKQQLEEKTQEAISQGKPDRDHAITQDEILNLRISLNTGDANSFIEELING